MADDEEWHVYPSGLAIKGSNGPRIVNGVDTMTGKPAGGQPPTPEEVEEAEARSREHSHQRAQSVFADPVWPVDRVLSWIGYRDVEAIEELFRPAMYRDSRSVIEGKPRIALLRALQGGSLRAIRQQGKLADRIHPDEWACVRREWSIDRWHECLFARSDVIALWPEVKRPALIAADSEVTEAPSPAAIPEAEVVSEVATKAGSIPVGSGTEEPGASASDLIPAASELKEQHSSSIQPCKAERKSPWRLQHLDLLKCWIAVDPMPQGGTRTEFNEQLCSRYGFIDRKLSRVLHGDPEVHPGKPGMGPHKSARGLGKK